MRYTKEEKETARKRLSFLKPGDVIYTELLSVSRSGMTRRIKPIVMVDNEPQWIGYHVAVLLDESLDNNGGVRMTGRGMDMGFSLVYDMSRALFPDGFGEKGMLPDGRKVRPVSKKQADRLVSMGKAEFYGRNGDKSGWDNDGGYALKQRWL